MSALIDTWFLGCRAAATAVLYVLFAVVAGGAVSAARAATVAASAPAPVTVGSGKKAVRQGISLELLVKPTHAEDGFSAAVVEGAYADVSLKMTDAATGHPVTVMQPRVWIDLRKGTGDFREKQMGCSDKVRTYLQGTLSFRPDIDLNSYFVLTLNNDASISVIDPIIGVAGYSQLYAMILLKRPGEDWVFSFDGKRLYVTMPKAGEVAEIDTDSLAVVRNIPAGAMPVRMAFQPDSRYLWVGNDSTDPARSGVTVIDPFSGTQAAFIQTGAGHHEIAFADDSRYAFVTNQQSGTLTIIDIQSLAPVKTLRLGDGPVSVAYSALSKCAHVVCEGDGNLLVVDGLSHEIISRKTFEPGFREVRFAPGDRWYFTVNGKNGQILVFDAAGNELLHSTVVAGRPEHVSFSTEFAYIRSLGTADVTLIPLAALGKAAILTPLVVSGGSRPPADSPLLPPTADPIVVTPEGNSVLIASPSDGAVVYYMEGMGVPMGSFKTYGRLPRAVNVINRQLRQNMPGVFSSRVKIPLAGTYDVAVLLDSPRIVQCFEFSADANPALQRLKTERPVMVEFVGSALRVEAGRESVVRFRVTDPVTHEPVADLRDLIVVTSLVPTGAWRQQLVSRPVGNGIYEVTFTARKVGIYSFNFAIPSLKVKLYQLAGMMIHAVETPAEAGSDVPAGQKKD
ncbi:YncE family protein [Geobacter sulfurreducens]|uniref:YncE family protein n=1 Tax=Geobacter sulfurreducens TaxID=35554 RepID=UPI0020B90152|nr:cytochrome D1 domain-containing protein [Geobacter sulfurreducens]UTG93919.1 hypothetical protein J8622_06265 [Geobacter sulfurreducens]